MEHCIFFVNKFQTVSAILEQLSIVFEYYLVLDSNTAVGYLGIRCHQDKLLLSKLYLRKQSRGSGIGSSVMQFVHNRAAEYDAKDIELEVSPKNVAAIRFYQSKGFSLADPILHQYENGYLIEDYKMIRQL